MFDILLLFLIIFPFNIKSLQLFLFSFFPLVWLSCCAQPRNKLLCWKFYYRFVYLLVCISSPVMYYVLHAMNVIKICIFKYENIFFCSSCACWYTQSELWVASGCANIRALGERGKRFSVENWCRSVRRKLWKAHVSTLNVSLCCTNQQVARWKLHIKYIKIKPFFFLFLFALSII